MDIPHVWKFNGEVIRICHNGYKWLSILPNEEYYCITAMLNDENQILLWYIDMIAGQRIDTDRVPYFDDLYLDLVVYPNGDIIVLFILVGIFHLGEIASRQLISKINKKYKFSFDVQRLGKIFMMKQKKSFLQDV